MRPRVRRREHTVVLFIAFLFILSLIAVNAIWPQGFTVFIAIGGTLGALMVLYEVRLTKQIAQAEFIRDLQTSFASDPNIGELWRRLLLDEKIGPDDRHLMSSYLTFFETVFLLQDRGALDLTMTDDLFRNRFFTAIGHPVVLRETLLKKVGAFTNIHELISVWYHHLLTHRKPIHDGYYSYIEAVLEAKGFEIVELNKRHLDGLLALQSTVLDSLEHREWLRENPAEALLECLTSDGSHVALGALRDGKLVAAAILYDGGTGKESIKRYLTDDEALMRESINLKLVLADPQYRRHRLGATLVKLLEQRAYKLGRREILCTIHPRNVPSSGLFKGLGYARERIVSTTYGKRAVYARSLRSIDAHWIR